MHTNQNHIVYNKLCIENIKKKKSSKIKCFTAMVTRQTYSWTVIGIFCVIIPPGKLHLISCMVSWTMSSEHDA